MRRRWSTLLAMGRIRRPLRFAIGLLLLFLLLLLLLRHQQQRRDAATPPINNFTRPLIYAAFGRKVSSLDWFLQWYGFYCIGLVSNWASSRLGRWLRHRRLRSIAPPRSTCIGLPVIGGVHSALIALSWNDSPRLFAFGRRRRLGSTQALSRRKTKKKLNWLLLLFSRFPFFYMEPYVFFHYVVCFQRQNVFFSPFQPNGALNGFSPVFLDVKRVFWKWKEYSTFMQPSIQLSRSSLLSLLLSAPLLLSIDIEYWKYSRIRLHHPAPDRTKVVDISGWMIKPVGPNSSSKCQLYSENNRIRWCWVARLHCVDFVPCFESLSLSRIATFVFPCQTCPFRWSHLARMEDNHLCLQNRRGCGCQGKCLSSSHTCN